MVKIRDIIFWILILAAVGVAIWLVFGSPSIEQGLLIIVIFIASSEILLWKSLFNIDKNTAVGFVKVKGELNLIIYNLDIIKNDIKAIKDILQK